MTTLKCGCVVRLSVDETPEYGGMDQWVGSSFEVGGGEITGPCEQHRAVAHVEWGYSEDGRGRPRGFHSTEDYPDAETWARAEAAEYRANGGQVFARAVSGWVVIRDE